MKKTGLLDVQILKTLREYASSKKPVSQKALRELLIETIGNEVDRKTLSEYLYALKEEGQVVQAHARGWYRENRFSDAELKMLIDCVFFGKQIPKEVAIRLIDKLKSISPINLKDYVKNVDYIEDVNHTKNEHVEEFLQIIGEAIENNKRLLITPQWLLHNDVYIGKRIIVDPYYIVSDKCRYYLICHVEREEGAVQIENRRVDRFHVVKILEEKRIPIQSLKGFERGLDLGNYMREHLYMFSGQAISVLMMIDEFRIGEFIDWYGENYELVKRYPDLQGNMMLEIRFTANENAIFYWTLQYGNYATILSPPALRDRLARHHRQMAKKYQLIEKELQSQ